MQFWMKDKVVLMLGCSFNLFLCVQFVIFNTCAHREPYLLSNTSSSDITLHSYPSKELVKLFLCPVQVRGRMLSTTTAIIHWDEPEEPNGQVVGYRVYYTSDNTLPVNQVCTWVCLDALTFVTAFINYR